MLYYEFSTTCDLPKTTDVISRSLASVPPRKRQPFILRIIYKGRGFRALRLQKFMVLAVKIQTPVTANMAIITDSHEQHDESA
ncbi:hypothetical protein llap_6040 [Limosa lapponica baueri]|uniref:Uncharacterized protein n=1 Tax=Limosa lapponica baueri TaxID=1758121 RepID=A0A2I0UC88_LIMLA|nr:hypothetical protein llap_6040 [Limosa lapponica baueri]